MGRLTQGRKGKEGEEQLIRHSWHTLGFLGGALSRVVFIRVAASSGYEMEISSLAIPGQGCVI